MPEWFTDFHHTAQWYGFIAFCVLMPCYAGYALWAYIKKEHK